MSRRIKNSPFIIIVFFCLLISSCSLRHFVVGHLDWFAMRQLDSYFDLTSEQYEAFDEKMKSHLRWFQKTKAPMLTAELLVIERAKDPLSKEYLKSLFQEKLRGLYLDVVDHVAEDAARLFKQLDPEQLAHLEEKVMERSKKYSDLMDLNEKEYLEEYADLQEKSIDRMENWVGSLSEAQKNKMDKLTFVAREQYREEGRIYVEIRKTFFVRLREKLARNASIDEIKNFLQGWAKNPDIGGDRYKVYREKRSERYLLVVSELEKTITNEQRAHRREQIAKTILDLKNLRAAQF